MPLRAPHRQVAAVALPTAAGHGFVLGGGNALIQHGVISRLTQDAGLFTQPGNGRAGRRPEQQEAAFCAAGQGLTCRTRAPAWITSSPAWAKAWPNGSSPRPAANR